MLVRATNDTSFIQVLSGKADFSSSSQIASVSFFDQLEHWKFGKNELSEQWPDNVGYTFQPIRTLKTYEN